MSRYKVTNMHKHWYLFHTCSNACSQFHTYQASSNILLQCAMCMLVKYGLLIVADLLYPKLQWWPVVREALPPMTRLGIAKRGLTMNQPRNATHGMQLTVTHAMHVLNSCNNKPNNRIRTKEWLLRLETLQTFEFDQNDKYKKTEIQKKDKKFIIVVSGQFRDICDISQPVYSIYIQYILRYFHGGFPKRRHRLTAHISHISTLPSSSPPLSRPALYTE